MDRSAHRLNTALCLAIAAMVVLCQGCLRDIDPGDLPEVRYTAPVNAYSGQTILFDASASFDPEGALEWYGFDFGDGSAALRGKSPIVEHTYERPGVFLTRVTVIDDIGNKFTELREIVIVARGSVPHLVCQTQRPYCPPFFLCDLEALRCSPDIDGDGVPSVEDADEPACASDAECPPGWRCEDALCTF